MAELGAGSGSSYPGALDTDSVQESTSKVARSDVPNDLAAAIIAIQTELGTDPAGSLTDVKTNLQTEHAADGTHAVVTATSIDLGSSTVVSGTLDEDDLSSDSATDLATQQSIKAYVDAQTGLDFTDGTLATVTVLATETDLLSIDLGTVAVGEIWLVTQTNNETGAAGIWTKGGTAGQTYGYIKKSSGTAVAKFAGGTLTPAFMQGATVDASETWSTSLSGVIEITTGGTLVLKYSGKSAGSNSTVWTNAVVLYAIKIKDA